ncbi:MAG: hypothetical protein LBK13_02590 [Spirochaetales bacterium]|jgi:hypothetical protein|nr:hypothetical protein [Spirochaetales bacterium]
MKFCKLNIKNSVGIIIVFNILALLASCDNELRESIKALAGTYKYEYHNVIIDTDDLFDFNIAELKSAYIILNIEGNGKLIRCKSNYPIKLEGNDGFSTINVDTVKLFLTKEFNYLRIENNKLIGQLLGWAADTGNGSDTIFGFGGLGVNYDLQENGILLKYAMWRDFRDDDDNVIKKEMLKYEIFYKKE